MAVPSEQLLYHATQARRRGGVAAPSVVRDLPDARYPLGEMPVRRLNALVDALIAGVGGLPRELASRAVSVTLADTALKLAGGKRAPADRARLLLRVVEDIPHIGWDRAVLEEFSAVLKNGGLTPKLPVRPSPEAILIHFCGSDPRAVWDAGPFAYISEKRALLCANRVFVRCPASLFGVDGSGLFLVRYLEVVGRSVVIPAEKEGARDPHWFLSISKRHEQLERLEALLRGESVPLGEVDAPWLSAYAAGAASVSRLWFSHMFGEMGDGEYSLFFLLSAMLGGRLMPPVVELFGFSVPPLSVWTLVELSGAERLSVSFLAAPSKGYLVFGAGDFLFALEAL